MPINSLTLFIIFPGMNSMAERTASDVCAFLNGIKFSDAELISLWIRLGSIYEKTNKFDQALETYLKCIRADVDNPIPLYRFVSVSRIHRPTMSSHCINLLGMHFLTFLAEYESSRLVAISDAAMQSIIDHDDNEKRQIRTHNLHESIRAVNGDLTNEQMLSAASKIMELEANPNLKNTFSFPENDVGVSRITRKRLIGRKRRKPQIRKSKKKDVPENKKRKSDKNGENEKENENESEGIEGMSSVDEKGSGMQDDNEILKEKDGNTKNNSSQAGEIDDDFGFEILGEINEELEAEENDGEADGEGEDDDDEEEDGVGEGEGEGMRSGSSKDNEVKGSGSAVKKDKKEKNGSDKEKSIEAIDGGVEEKIEKEIKVGEGMENEKENGTVKEGKKGVDDDIEARRKKKELKGGGYETENDEGDGLKNATKYALGTRKYSRFTLENELRAIALWAIMLQETGNLID